MSIITELTAGKYLDFDPEFWPMYEKAKPFTMTSPEKMYDLYETVKYICKWSIGGNIIECGVWKGGSMLLVAQILKQFNSDKRIYMFDTFSGMPLPDPELDIDQLGNVAIDRWRENWVDGGSKQAVKANMDLAGYPHFSLIEGKVEATLHNALGTTQFSLVRLDTDWYASTKVELEVLWPRLVPGGFLIIDDFGSWLGCRKAVLEYFAHKKVKMTRIDNQCRVIQKL